MAYRQELIKIGADGFALLEHGAGKQGKPLPLPPRHGKPHVSKPQYRDPYPSWGLKGPQSREATVLDCDGAARIFGGVLIKEFGKKPQPLRKAYYA